MALATYTDLQTALANYLARPGDSLIATPTPDFVALAEARIAYGGDAPFACSALRLRAMETAAILIAGAAQAGGTSTGSANAQAVTLAKPPTIAPGLAIDFTAGFSNSGAATLDAGPGPLPIKKGVPQADLAAGDLVAGGGYEVYCDGSAFNLVPSGGVPLPAGFLEMRSLVVQGPRPRQLSPVTPQDYSSTCLALGRAEPEAFTLAGDCLRLGPAPDATYAVEMAFYRKLPALSATNPSNWLMANKPDVYLWAALLEAATYLGDDEGAQRYFALYRAAAEGLMNANARDRFGGAALQLRSGVMGA
jgi:hypothetical protein